VISSVRDISGRMQAEESLRYNEERFRLALLASNQGWFDLDVASGEGTASAEYAQMIGREPVSFRVTAQTWLDGVHPDDRELLGRVYRECLKSGGPRTMEYRRQSATGEWKWIRSVGKVVAFDDFGNPLRLIGTHTDITERKELEAKLLNSQRLETVGTLAGGVAHDLNNILTPILMSTSVLRGNLRDPADRELIAMLEQGAQRGAAIVRQLLTFSRNLEQQRAPLNLRPMIQETLRSLRPGLVQGIAVVENIDTELWHVVGASVQMQQVLSNLCANALDAMPTGGVLTISAQNTAFGDGVTSRNPWGKAGRFVTMTVSDTGRGITAENIGRVFDPFYTTKEVGRGPGLGLSAVFGIVKAHGGNVSVSSEPGQGAVFRVVLPAEASGVLANPAAA
jgi:PAS domain S-box-containing protein